MGSKYPKGFMRTDYYEGKSASLRRRIILTFTASLCTPDAVYFTFNTHTDGGDG